MAFGGDTDRMTSCDITSRIQNTLLPSNPCKSPSRFPAAHILSSRGAGGVLGFISAASAKSWQRYSGVTQEQTDGLRFACLFVLWKIKNSAVQFEGVAFALKQVNPVNCSSQTTRQHIEYLARSSSCAEFSLPLHVAGDKSKPVQRFYLFFSLFPSFFRNKHSWDWRNVSVSVRSMKCNLCLVHPVWTAHLYSPQRWHDLTKYTNEHF